jgi:hypothetical protein
MQETDLRPEAHLKFDEQLPFAEPDEWHKYIQAELDAGEAAYAAKPAFLVRDFNDERQTRDDYAGRELLELIQNAADAASEVGGAGRVLIEVRKSGMFVANTGQAFRPSGVTSLMTAHLSDKPQRKKGLIGSKGLGFRAILNWSREPLISSGALEIAFSQTHAHKQVHSLTHKHRAIGRFLQTRQMQPAPVLPFPLFGDHFDDLDKDGLERLAYCRQLRSLG